MDSKAEKKLAKKLAREQLQIQLRKDSLAREVSLDEKSLKKIKDQWLDTLIETKVPEMQDNLKQLFYYMEKLIEAENFRKKQFEEERQELEEKCNLLSEGHSSALEMLCEIYERRVQDLREFYTNMMMEKKTQAEEEFKAINDHEENTQENMHTLLHLMKENQEKKQEVMNYGMFLKIDDEKSKNIELLDNMQSKMEKKMEKRWGEITNVLSTYEKNTSTRRKEYLLLKAKDDSDSKIISNQMKKTQKLFDQVEELKSCIDECYAPKEIINLIQDLREERTQFFETFKSLKAIVAEELKGDEVNLRHLTTSSDAVTEDLKRIREKGEQILTLYRICLRLETQSEKVFPVGLSIRKTAMDSNLFKAIEKEARRGKRRDTTMSNIEIHSRMKTVKVMDKFWKKVGRVKLSKLALKKCIQNMKKENKVLKQLLAMYLKEFSNKAEQTSLGWFLIKLHHYENYIITDRKSEIKATVTQHFTAQSLNERHESFYLSTLNNLWLN